MDVHLSESGVAIPVLKEFPSSPRVGGDIRRVGVTGIPNPRNAHTLESHPSRTVPYLLVELMLVVFEPLDGLFEEALLRLEAGALLRLSLGPI